MWERLSSRDQTVTTLEQLLFVAGKPLPREIDAITQNFESIEPQPLNPRMRLRLAEAMNRHERRTSNFQHRTSNIDDATLYRL